MRALFAFCMIIGAVAGFKNPVVNSDAPDPGILYHGGKWWMVTTGGNFAIRSSDDLVTWKHVGYILNDGNRPAWAEYNFWAPELHVVNGKINAYFSAHSKSGQYAIGGARADSPAGPYKTFENYLVTCDYGTIDASVATDNSTGTQYLLWKVDGNAYGVSTPIYAAKLNADGSAIVGSQTKLLDRDLAWEENLVEGGWIIYRKGWYYMFYSGSGYASATYASGVARSKNVLGPYEKGWAPIMSQYADGAQTWAGPGHGSVVQIPGTDVWYMIYHSWYSGKVGSSPGRVVLADRVYFDSDGWPVVGMCNTPTTGDQPMPMSKEAAALSIDQRVFKNGKQFTISSYQWSDHCIGEAATIDGDCSKDRYYARVGLKGGNTISFESVRHPGSYLRHADGKIRLDANDKSDLFAKDASWHIVAGLKDGSNKAYVSIRPINYPFNYIRHYDGSLRLDAWDKSDTMAKDATWRITYV